MESFYFSALLRARKDGDYHHHDNDPVNKCCRFDQNRGMKEIFRESLEL